MYNKLRYRKENFDVVGIVFELKPVFLHVVVKHYNHNAKSLNRTAFDLCESTSLLY